MARAEDAPSGEPRTDNSGPEGSFIIGCIDKRTGELVDSVTGMAGLVVRKAGMIIPFKRIEFGRPGEPATSEPPEAGTGETTP